MKTNNIKGYKFISNNSYNPENTLGDLNSTLPAGYSFKMINGQWNNNSGSWTKESKVTIVRNEG